jgi:signal transduction histidine kinase
MHASRFSSIFAALPFGLVATDSAGRIVAANPAVEELLGWRPDGWCGRSLGAGLEHVIADPARALWWTVALSQALGQGRTTYLSLPVDFNTGLDDRPCVSITGVVTPWSEDGAGRPGALAVFHDTAHYKNLAEQRDRFFSVISHELGSPVTNIAAAADLLRQQMAQAPAAQQRLIQIVQDEAARFRRMIGQFLAVSPAQAGALRPVRNPVTLRPLLQRVAQTFSLRDTEHELIVQVPAGLPFVEGDADRIQEVLCNLIDNAVRYSPPGTRIVVAAEAQADRVLISVADEGVGIPAGDESRIFEPFFRGQSEQKGEGQGVGLYIARTLVQAMGGELWHEQQPGHGSRFCFTLLRMPGLVEEGEGNGCQDPGR